MSRLLSLALPILYSLYWQTRIRAYSLSGRLGLILYSLFSRSRIGSLFFIQTGGESALYCPKALYTAFSPVQNFFAQYRFLASPNTIFLQVPLPFFSKSKIILH